MITQDDIDGMTEPKTQLVVIDTMQFFEIEVPLDTDPEIFLTSDECRKICAEQITSNITDLEIHHVLTKKDLNGYWINE